MRKTAVGVFIVLAAAATLRGQAADQWISYRAPDARFEARFPTMPFNTTQQTTNRDGQPLAQHLVSAADGDNAFLIGYFDILPTQIFTFPEARDGMLQSVGGRLLLETPITVGPYSGFDMVVAATNNAIPIVLNVRIIRTPKRAYVVQAIFPANAAYQSEKTAKFFGAFRILSD